MEKIEMTSKLTKSVLGAALLAGGASINAAEINVGGVVWDPDDPQDFFSRATLNEMVVQNVGDVLSGFGKITEINSLVGPNESTFCPSCELTFVFNNYALANTDPNNIIFTGGTMQVYVDSSPNYDITDMTSATDGNLWLDLVALDYLEPGKGVGSLFGQITGGSLGAGDETGNGSGFLSVVGGMAAGNFDTDFYNGILDAGGNPVLDADLLFSSSFQPQTQALIDIGALPLRGTGEIAGNTIPEPSTLFLLGMGMLGLGYRAAKKTA